MKRRDALKKSAILSSTAILPAAAKAGLLAGLSTLLDNVLNNANAASAQPSMPPASSRLGASLPLLPQNDSFIGKINRRNQVNQRHIQYRWTTRFPNATGIPMATTVTYDDLPSLEWLLKFASIIARILVNFIAAIPGELGVAWKTTIDRICRGIDSAQASYDSILKNPSGSNTPQRLANLNRNIIGLLTDINSFIRGAIAPTDAGYTAMHSVNGEDKYKALFATIKLPEYADHFHRDDVFARLRVSGQNPVLIQGVSELPAKFPLTDQQYRQVMGNADDLSAAARERRLYLLDYVDNRALATSGPVSKLLTGKGYAFAPIALFARPRGAESLVPVAIQCGQDPANHPIFLPAPASDESAYWAWQQAKTVVQNAEENYHEMYVHLARTHLVSEAFAMATNRNLPPAHPLHPLLMPHFEGTLFINEGAALALLPNVPLGFINTLFAAPIPRIAAEIAADRLAFDFYEHMLPRELANRKIDNPYDLPDYPYRDDGMLIWNAIRRWVGEYVGVYYLSDSAVINDYELAAWTKDVAGSGRVKGFVTIQSRQQLIDVLTLVIFNASAQHAAVNFSQPDYCLYAPALSALSCAPAPTSINGQSRRDWEAMLPPMISAIERIAIYTILGGVHYRKLGDYLCNSFPHRPLMVDPRITGDGGPLQRFRQSLEKIEDLINLRNRNRPWPYPYLLPSRIPASTNI
ncbi:lipoxygenase family protein [Burkholderia gladioli]|uniref:lipoxygenase family protein n=1 Tax=Burkholderia gladioli TaxID=28095 RepID=UPI0034DB42F1